MGMTIAEKILAKNSGMSVVKPGQYVIAKVDRIIASGSLAETYEAFKEIGIDKVWNPHRVIALTTEHLLPARDIESAQKDVLRRKFAQEFGLTFWYDVGRGGISHQIVPENGHAVPATLVLGTDSHTTSYGAFNVLATGTQIPESYWVIAKGETWFKVPETLKFNIFGELPPRVMAKDVILRIIAEYGTDVALSKSIEFVGPAVKYMSLSSRWAIAGMGVEMGAKFTIFEADHKTLDFLQGRVREPFTPVTSDPDASFEKIYHLDISNLSPHVACPHDVSNVIPISKVGSVPINQGFIGSCIGGRLEDLMAASEILKGKKVHPRVRLIVIPASMEVYKDALRTGVLETFVEADAIVCGPTCGPCAGDHLGVLAAREKCIAASSRNFKGRMGSPEAEVYLASPATVAASAVTGFITDPREV